MKDRIYISRLIWSILLLFGLAEALSAQNGLRSADGWGCGWNCTDYWTGTGFGTSFGKTYQNSSGNGVRYFRLYTEWDFGASQAEHGPTGNNDVQINIATPTLLETWGANNGKAYYINVSGGTNNYNYVFRTKFGNGIDNTPQLIVFEVQGDVGNIINVDQSPPPAGVNPSTTVTVTAETDAPFNAGQSIYLRYTTDAWNTSTIQEMSGTGTSYSGEIPSQTGDTEVDYYVFTSGPGLTIAHNDADWYTINGNTNNGTNFSYTVQSGNVTVTPPYPTDAEEVTISFDVTGTSLADAAKIYLHSGVSVTESEPTDFNFVVGNWGQDDGIGEMSNTSGNTWEITISPGSRIFYGVPDDKDIFGLNFLFRNSAGDIKVDNNGQNYHTTTDPGDYFSIDNPFHTVHYGEVGTTLDHGATASTEPDTWTLTEIDTLTSAYISTIQTQSGGTGFVKSIDISNTSLRKFKLTVDFGNQTKYKTFYIRGYSPVVIMPKPEWVLPGINYHESDPAKATLVLHAPTYTNYKKGNGTIGGTNTTTPKEFIYVTGDFNGWNTWEGYKMKRDTGDLDNYRGDYWWIELSGLNPGEEYVFQYFIDGHLQVADPYTHKVSDPDDQYIPETVYPEMITYRSQAVDRASILQTQRDTFQWTAPEFTKPAINELNIYELLFRDFTEEGTYLAAIEKLDYIKGLGINAIHVMPVSEFEGNSSWGYNPNFYFAADKAYGTENDLKKFIDECHKRGIMVFNDIVLNHAFYSNVNAKMYWNDELNRPADDNPWFNPEHKMVYDQAGHWGADWNHESEHVQTMVDRITDYWIQEFRFDGFRFDFTKGFGQSPPDPSDPWASNYNQDRIDLLLRMANSMKSRNPGSVVIFEHLANPDEERELANTGILMWSGAGHHNAVKNFTLGWNNDNTNIYSSGVYESDQNDFTYANLISYAESHDEQQLAYELWNHFNWSTYAGPKVTYEDSLAAVTDRLKIGSGFNLLLPGPRMIWQFQELGYEYDINFNGRTGEKPVHWEYYDDQKRRELYTLISRILKIRNNYNIYHGKDYGNIDLGPGNITTPRRMRFSTNDGKHVIIVANLDPASGHEAFPGYPVTGTWYKYNGDPAVDGSSFEVSDTEAGYYLNYSEMLVLTNFEIDRCTDVRNTNDSGANSLRGAIDCAADGDTIIMEFPVYGDTIVLESPIIIEKDITIDGFYNRNIVISGNGTMENIFSIAVDKSVTIRGVTLYCAEGNNDGRCLINNGYLTLDNAYFHDTDNTGSGSSIKNDGSGTIIIRNNVNISDQ